MSQFKLEDADVLIDLANQTLALPKYNKFYVISTGKNGIGEKENTGKTPRGWHRVAQKIGAQSPKNAVFIARKPTGEVYNAELATQYPERDWILSRILWLDGLENGFNKGEGCDTMQRTSISMELLIHNQWVCQCHMAVFECVMKKSLNYLIWFQKMH